MQLSYLWEEKISFCKLTSSDGGVGDSFSVASFPGGLPGLASTFTSALKKKK